MLSGIIFEHFIFGLESIFSSRTWKSTIFGKNPFGRQPGVSWQGPCFSEITPPGFWGPIYGISGFSENEKDAESHLEQGPPSFSP